MPHWAFEGLTPDEVYFGKTAGVVEALAAGRAVVRGDRLKTNQAASCPEHLHSAIGYVTPTERHTGLD